MARTHADEKASLERNGPKDEAQKKRPRSEDQGLNSINFDQRLVNRNRRTTVERLTHTVAGGYSQVAFTAR